MLGFNAGTTTKLALSLVSSSTFKYFAASFARIVAGRLYDILYHMIWGLPSSHWGVAYDIWQESRAYWAKLAEDHAEWFTLPIFYLVIHLVHVFAFVTKNIPVTEANKELLASVKKEMDKFLDPLREELHNSRDPNDTEPKITEAAYKQRLEALRQHLYEFLTPHQRGSEHEEVLVEFRENILTAFDQHLRENPISVSSSPVSQALKKKTSVQGKSKL